MGSFAGWVPSHVLYLNLATPKDPSRPTSTSLLHPHPKSLWWAASPMHACTLLGFCFSLAVREQAGGMCKHPLQHARKLEEEAHRLARPAWVPE